MRKFLPLLAFAALWGAEGVAAQEWRTIDQMSKVGERLGDKDFLPTIGFSSRLEGEVLLGWSQNNPFSVLICNHSGEKGMVYIDPVNRKLDRAVMPYSCLFLKDVTTVGTAKGTPWGGYAYFYV